MIDKIEALGLCAGALTTLSFIPQIRKLWKSKSTKDISFHMYAIYCTGLMLWTIYGFLINSLSLIIANFITLVFAFSIVLMKLRWDSLHIDS